MAHAEPTPDDELYRQKILDSDAAREDGHDRLQRNVGSGEQRERVWNIVRGEVGIFDEGAGGDETNVGLVDAAELVGSSQTWGCPGK